LYWGKLALCSPPHSHLSLTLLFSPAWLENMERGL
jgi:hypothetical protein